jgi:hypothetical protein
MEGRITTEMNAEEILGTLRNADGYYLCNNERMCRNLTSRID